MEQENSEEAVKDALPLFGGDNQYEPENTAEEENPQPQEPEIPEPAAQQEKIIFQEPERKIDISGIPVSSFGAYLRAVRERNNVTIAELAESTKIRSTYIEAVEAEDFDSLPPVVYVLAYIKKLCRCLQIPENIVEELTGEIQRHLEYESPEDPSKTVVDVELSTENPVIFKRILIFGGMGIFLLVLLISLAIFLLFPSGGSENSSAASSNVKIDENTLLSIQDTPEMKISELEQKR